MIVILFLFSASSCKKEVATNPQGRPVAERTSVHYLLPPVDTAHDGVIEAERLLSNDPPDIVAARDFLNKAAESLANLEWFYIPATEARDNVYNAYLEQLAGHTDLRDSYLDSAKAGLMKISVQSSARVQPYIADLADRIEAVQSSIRDGTPVNDELKSLCEFFQVHLLKAQLAIDEHAFDEQRTEN